MNSLRPFLRPIVFTLCVGLTCLAFTGCEYDVPLTAKPTRPIEQKLLGDWTATDGKDQMRVRQFDDFNYAVTYNGDLYRAHHSEITSTPFVSVLHLDLESRKYAFLTWSLSDDNRRLRLRVMSSKVVSKETRDSAALQKEVQKNLTNPALFGFEQEYVRKK